MILDLEKFISKERPIWKELEKILLAWENDPFPNMPLEQVKHFHYLYQRTSSDLDKVVTFTAETEIRGYLESLVGRAYSEIHGSRKTSGSFFLFRWFFGTFPQTFRRHWGAFLLSLMITLAGVSFGGMAISFDTEAKSAIMIFSHLLGDPSERVKEEEEAKVDRLEGNKSAFSAQLMTHNTQVSIFTFALGFSWGIGTIIVLFSNGVFLGAVVLDYILAGETTFLLGWLLPHGVVEIPAILLAGQAGLILAHALIGWGTRHSLKMRLRKVTDDLTSLIGGIAVMLIWAGIIESFLSQYHEPVLPYSVKIGFGIFELTLLILFFSRSGKKKPQENQEKDATLG